MRASFLESKGFTDWVRGYRDEWLAALQNRLMVNPEAGAVMPGCGALRKVRVDDPKRGKGRRGGVRVIYVYVPEGRQFLLVAAYDKDEMDTPSKAQQRVLKALSDQFRDEVRKSLPPAPDEDRTDG